MEPPIASGMVNHYENDLNQLYHFVSHKQQLSMNFLPFECSNCLDYQNIIMDPHHKYIYLDTQKYFRAIDKLHSWIPNGSWHHGRWNGQMSFVYLALKDKQTGCDAFQTLLSLSHNSSFVNIFLICLPSSLRCYWRVCFRRSVLKRGPFKNGYFTPEASSKLPYGRSAWMG